MTKRTWWTLGAVLFLATGLGCGSSSSPTDLGSQTLDIAADHVDVPVETIDEDADANDVARDDVGDTDVALDEGATVGDEGVGPDPVDVDTAEACVGEGCPCATVGCPCTLDSQCVDPQDICKIGTCGTDQKCQFAQDPCDDGLALAFSLPSAYFAISSV